MSSLLLVCFLLQYTNCMCFLSPMGHLEGSCQLWCYVQVFLEVTSQLFKNCHKLYGKNIELSVMATEDLCHI